MKTYPRHHSAFCSLHSAFAAFAVALATANAAFGRDDAFVIAENGLAKAAIVIPQDAPKSARYAARQLAKYLDQMTGANVPVADRPLRGYNTIRVGFPHEGPPEEIAISVRKRDLAEITGAAPAPAELDREALAWFPKEIQVASPVIAKRFDFARGTTSSSWTLPPPLSPEIPRLALICGK